MSDICVVGGGAAGLTAAYFAACGGGRVTVYERNPVCGKKLGITGKGRCNLTNLCDVQELLLNVPTNPRFLYKALSAFPPEEVMRFFEGLGVPLKVERGRRVFPVSDRAADVTAALVNACRSVGVRIVCGSRVRGVFAKDGRFSHLSLAGGGKVEADGCIIATGGASYPRTGSEGDGYAFAAALGHTVVRAEPSLIPLCSDDPVCAACMGLSLKNVRASFFSAEGKPLYSEMGEMLFTHFGVSGPIILSASAHVGDAVGVRVVIDLKPALDCETLDKRLLRDFEENRNRDFANGLSALLPQKLIPIIVEKSGISPHKKINSVTKEERKALVKLLKGFSFTLSGKRPLSEAIITRGGVSVKEISPSTMESKLVGGLYFAGEVIDVDAYTGGYNLQIAFSTGRLAGLSAASRPV